MIAGTMAPEIAAAIVAAQAALKTVIKDAKNEEIGNSYAKLDTIVEQVRPVLAEHKLAFMQHVRVKEDNFRLWFVDTTLIHASGATYTTTVPVVLTGRRLKGGAFGEPDAQSSGSVITYGRRYGLSAALGIVTDTDDDGNLASQSRERREEPRREERQERGQRRQRTSETPQTGTGTRTSTPAAAPAREPAKPGTDAMVVQGEDGKVIVQGQPLDLMPAAQLDRVIGWMIRKKYIPVLERAAKAYLAGNNQALAEKIGSALLAHADAEAAKAAEPKPADETKE